MHCEQIVPMCYHNGGSVFDQLNWKHKKTKKCHARTRPTFTIAAVTNSSLFASRAAVGSSRSKIGLGLRKARAIAMRCFWPMLRPEPAALKPADSLRNCCNCDKKNNFARLDKSSINVMKTDEMLQELKCRYVMLNISYVTKGKGNGMHRLHTRKFCVQSIGQ